MTDDSLLDQLAAEFTQRVREGKPPDIEEFANRYPQLAGRIRELLSTLVMLEEAAAVKQDASSDQTSSKTPQSESPQERTLPHRQRFVAGAVLTGRYRIISVLGKGGMGEVYRAEDLKLAQSVALKFLPENLAVDGAALARLYREVNIARQVSHPNVCRVYDIGETPAEHFLSMEYIDGEDLASLLRRIGRLPAEKAIEIGCQLCAGLASIHETGVLHRDIKPANIIIDRHGRARITDFGLASVADQLREISRAGTPAYMAPEQLQGGKVTQKTDIYALGLVLYEMFTGKRALTEDGENLGSIQDRVEPTAPSDIIRDLDPRIEQLILRCLDRSPQIRPSAKEIGAALSGRDLMATALEAGEIPSPEMVAAAGRKDGWRPWFAWACLAFVIFGIGATFVLSRRYLLVQRVPLEKPPAVLVERARDILRKIGHSEVPVDSAFGFERHDSYFQYVRSHDRSSSRWDWLPDSALSFWYRQSPSILARKEMAQESFFYPVVGVTSYDPPQTISGEASVWLDCRGRLIYLEVQPPEVDKSDGVPHATDWSILFREAGLDQAKWTVAEPIWTPPRYADARVAWQGVLPERPEITMRIEAAACRGKPIFWQLTGPWAEPSPTKSEPASIGGTVSNILTVSIAAALIIGGALIARRNLRMGRGDRRGASRLAFFVFSLMAIAWIFSEHHVASPYELYLFDLFAGIALLTSGELWLLYISLEPFVRRRWPVSLISWSRLLSGRFRDSLVGRDVLFGCVIGVVQCLLDQLNFHISAWIGGVYQEPYSGRLQLLTGARAIIPVTSSALIMSIEWSIFALFIFFLLRVLLRKSWAAILAFMVIFTTVEALGGESLILSGIFGALGWGITLLALVRFGLLATASGIFAYWLLKWFPITTQLSAWYSGIGISGIAMVLILAIYAFHTSLDGQPLFGRTLLED